MAKLNQEKNNDSGNNNPKSALGNAPSNSTRHAHPMKYPKSDSCNHGASQGMNNVPFAATTTSPLWISKVMPVELKPFSLPLQGVNQWQNITEDINFKSPSPGALMAPPHLSIGANMTGKISSSDYQNVANHNMLSMGSESKNKSTLMREDIVFDKSMRKDSSNSGSKRNVVDLERVEKLTPTKTIQFFPHPRVESSSRPSKMTKLMQDKTNEEFGRQNKGADN